MSLLSLCGFMSDAIADIWMSIWLSLNDFVYSIISVLYQVFEGVANVNLFSEATFKKITSRIYIIMGIAMLFIFAYNLVLMIINPEEKKSTGQTTKIVKETIISLVLVILLPTIFNYMSIFQRHVLESGILSQIILGDTGGTSAEKCDYSQYTIYNEYDIGNVEDTSFLNWKTILSLGIYQIYLSTKDSTPTSMLTESCKYYSDELSPSQRGAYALPATIFSAFYYPTRVDYNSCEDWIEKCKDDINCSSDNVSEPEDKEMCAYYVYDVKLAKYMGNIAPFNTESKFYSKVKADDGTFEFNGLLALAAGVLALYMFVCYTIAIGTRVAKLGFLQIISPIAVMMRIIPKQKEAMFDKWLKNLINTYLDVFIRLIIIYFSLFAISLVPDVIETLFKNFEGSSWYVAALSTVVVILGILMFAQKAPELFKEFFGGAGNFALKSPSKQLSENKLGSSALGAVGAGAASLAGNFWNAGKNIKNAAGIGGKAKALGKGVLSTIGGTMGGSVRGARYGYGANGFKDLGNKIAEAKYATDAAQEEGIGNRIKHKAKKVGDGFVDFGQFITGTGATNFRLQSVELSLKDVQNINANFKNGKIEGIESAFNKMNDDYNNNKPINFNGREYLRTERGWVNKNDSSDVMSHDDMGKAIKDHFDALKKAEYVKQYADNEKAFDRLTSKMVNTLNENFPKIGSEIVDGINDKLKDTGIHFENVDDITSKISELMKDGNRQAIYDINDAIEKNLKNVKKEVIIAQQEKKDK